MKKPLSRNIRLLALVAVGAGAAAHAADLVQVTKLRASKVVMFDNYDNGSAIGELAREQYVPGSWVVAGEPRNGLLPVKSEGRTFWVKAFAVDTDRKVAASAECGVVLASAEQKIGATRSLGEECRK